ncbi:porphobilinogen deaminase, dipyromethane cofactor binding domain-containing protein [Lipomyces arxii]|uniref:porphobilinogen deaminase, dipyromethane cofactor binding domain-containing protein n=1 Tax=Lipomyces arxii TaxID=56418 RepID=UPI0034CEC7A7
MTRTIKLGSRTSALAVKQSEIVADKLKQQFPEYEFKIVTRETLGDERQDKALYDFGGKAVWTTELEELLARTGDNGVDMIVHSLKDVPTNLPEEFVLGSITERADPRDALCVRSDLPYKSLAELPDGSIVGTSSVRRIAQLKRQYPNLETKIVRGNINTRLAKLENKENNFAGVILAAAGLLRIDLDYAITQYLSAPDVLYAVGQGALGVEIKKNDMFIQSLLDKVTHVPTSLRCTAERSLMHKLEGGCSVPLAVESSITADGELTMETCIISVDGSEKASTSLTASVKSLEEAESFGSQIADMLIAEGATKILDKINYDKVKQAA